MSPLKSGRRWRLAPAWAPYLFLSPFLLLFAVFALVPMLLSLLLACQSWDPADGLAGMRFVGLDNFRYALDDPWFWRSLGNTVWLTLAAGVPQHLAALPLAWWLYGARGRWRGMVLGAWFMPYVTAPAAVALVFGNLFATDFGLVNLALARLPAGWLPAPIDWLNQPAFIKPAIAVLVWWRYVGFTTVLYLAALRALPAELFEAAELDGAGRWRQFLHVALPQLRPMIAVAATLSAIGGLQLFDEPFMLTGGRGAAGQAGMTTAVHLFRTAFEFGDYGTASAIAWLLCLCIAALAWLTARMTAGRSAP